MSLSLLIFTLGLLLYILSAYKKSFILFLMASFICGIGNTFLQASINPYITILGTMDSAAKRMSIMGICNKLAWPVAPVFLAWVIGKSTTEISEISDLILPFYIIIGVFILLGLLSFLAPIPEVKAIGEDNNTDCAYASGKTSIWQFPHLILGAVALFLHVGSQVVGINTVIGYAQSLGLPLLEAKVFPSYILGLTMCGFLSGIVLIPRYINHLNVLRVCTTSAVVLTILFFLVHGQVSFLGHTADLSIWFLVVLGLANSLMWSAIWPLALNGLGRFTKMGGSILVMGLCGSAIVPIFYGYFADHFDLHVAYWVLMPCYLYLVYYAYHGYRVKNWSFKKVNES